MIFSICAAAVSSTGIYICVSDSDAVPCTKQANIAAGVMGGFVGGSVFGLLITAIIAILIAKYHKKGKGRRRHQSRLLVYWYNVMNNC